MTEPVRKAGVPGMIQKMQEEERTVLSPPQLLEQAIRTNAGVEVIERLMALQERWETNQARKAFNAAIAAFKADAPEILKTVEVAYDGRGGKTSYKHEDLAKVLESVDKALAQHGLWVRFKTATTNNLVTVTCVVGHADGHTEQDNVLSAAPDTSGSKNAVQAIGSVVTYLQRYTLKAALGVAAARDDDGRAAGPPVGVQTLSPAQVDQIEAILKENPDKLRKKFLELAGAETVHQVMAVKFDSSMQFLNRHGKKKEAEK